ncbi:MAG TPA: RHS repeat-associated core domain-containing protein [Planctomycetes bacterium]|nr:RHS repeat-associated core domain-containing protein [Planctomycetota bacterium]
MKIGTGAQPIAFYQGDYTDPAYIYLHDRLGSVRQVLDSAGNVKNTYTYTPFGTDPNSQFAETVDNPFMFTGQWYDSETEQYYLRERQYDPQLMRFTAVDPVLGVPYQPQTFHRYLYCANDPLNSIDPDGRSKAFAAQLLAPVMAGHGVHIIAVSMMAYAVSQMNFDMMDLAIDFHDLVPSVVAVGIIGGPAASMNIINEFSRRHKERFKAEKEFYTMLNEMANSGDGSKPPDPKDPRDWKYWARWIGHALWRLNQNID